MAYKSERCKGCGGLLVLALTAHSPVRKWGSVLCEHLMHRPSCAECYYETGRCIEWDGKIVVLDSLHTRKYVDVYGLVGCSNQGKLLQFGDSRKIGVIQGKMDLMRSAPPIVQEGSGWRG